MFIISLFKVLSNSRNSGRDILFVFCNSILVKNVFLYIVKEFQMPIDIIPKLEKVKMNVLFCQLRDYTSVF